MHPFCRTKSSWRVSYDTQIVGTTAEIEKFIREFEIEQIVFCIPSCLEDERKRILDICSKTELPIKVILFLGNLLFDDAHTTLLGQVRDIRVEDLLGRDPIKFDNADIKEFISGKVCMVTGSGGSIGSELVRQIAKYDPKQIIIVDIYENNAYDIQQELIEEYGKDLNLIVRIASVRDYFHMNQLFNQFHPRVVFHAAAHKHIPLMEDSPMEAIKNNVIGTFNAATPAQFHNVQKFVMISTDKAVNPTNCMGASFSLQKTKNQLIFIGRLIGIDTYTFITQLRSLCDAALENNEATAIRALHEMVPTFVTPEEFYKKFISTTAKAGSEDKKDEKVPVSV